MSKDLTAEDLLMRIPVSKAEDILLTIEEAQIDANDPTLDFEDWEIIIALLEVRCVHAGVLKVTQI